LSVTRVAVGVVRGLSKHADGARFLFPFEDLVVRYVAPQQIPSVAKPHGALAPTHARGEPFDLGQIESVLGERRVEDFDQRIRIPLARLPFGGTGGHWSGDLGCKCHRGGGKCGGEKCPSVHGKSIASGRSAKLCETSQNALNRFESLKKSSKWNSWLSGHRGESPRKLYES